jgi:hypothetical protein
VQLQPDPVLRALLDETIAVNLDGRRYYGLPLRPPHNHGLMANLALIATGRILGRPTLVSAAESRLLTDVRAVIDPSCGMVFEQSSGYQGLNARLWTKAADTLAAAGRAASAATIRAAAQAMATAGDLLVAPDGFRPAIGDGNPVGGFLLTARPQTRMLCRTAGWAAARTSWTATASHYVLRFGPRRELHGQDDHGSMTWTSAGVAVLTDPGSGTDLVPAYHPYQVSNAAHSVLGVRGVEFSGATTLLRAVLAPDHDVYVLRDAAGGVTRTRSVRTDSSLPLLMVLDRANATVGRVFTQRWHFAQRWRWNAARGRLSDGTATAGVVSIDLRTGGRRPRAASSAWIFPTPTAVMAPVLSAVRSGTSVALFSVVYVSVSGVRPVLRWYPGRVSGTGFVRVWWGRAHRDVRIDGTGIRG